VIHGAADCILPLGARAARLPELVGNLRLVTIDDGPHLIAWTHHEEVNDELLSFLTH
jgi:non-heme chloroperoxidase